MHLIQRELIIEFLLYYFSRERSTMLLYKYTAYLVQVFIKFIQSGSNMTGTNCDLFTHK
jgi:hypothetical protein